MLFNRNRKRAEYAVVCDQERKVLRAREIPFATLMYIRAKKAPVDPVISNWRSGRVKIDDSRRYR